MLQTPAPPAVHPGHVAPVPPHARAAASAPPPGRPPAPPGAALAAGGDGTPDRPIPKRGDEVIVGGLAGKILRVYHEGRPGSAVDVLLAPPGGPERIQSRVPHGGDLGWKTSSEVEAEARAQAERVAAAGSSPWNDLPVYPAPSVNGEVLVGHARAMAVRVHRADPDSPCDLVVYDAVGTPTLRADVPHGAGPGQWSHPQEVLDRRAAMIAADSGPPADFEPRVGRFVRFALGGEPDAGGNIEVVPCRGLIRRVTTVHVPERGGAVAQLLVTLYPLDPPAEPHVPDEPLPEGDRVAFPACPARPESRATCYRGEWTPLADPTIVGGAFHMSAMHLQLCSFCKEHLPAAHMAGRIRFEPRPGSAASERILDICPRCKPIFLAY